MIANYHTHTPRCNHARGTEEEYVQNALAQGLKILGFSDHSPYLFPDGYYSHFRMKPHQLDDYVETVLDLRDRYAGSIALHCGLEIEYYPKFFPEVLAMLRDRPVEYLILGQHFVGNEINDHYSGQKTDDEELLRRYCHQVMDAMNTGLFTYLAHPDLVNFVGEHRIYEKHIRSLCREANNCNIPLEINLQGLAEGRHYPKLRFWQLAAEERCKAVIGYDAHDPKVLLDPEPERRALELAEKCGIEVVETVQLRGI